MGDEGWLHSDVRLLGMRRREIRAGGGQSESESRRRMGKAGWPMAGLGWQDEDEGEGE